MCAEKSEGASYGMEALALGGLTETGLLLVESRCGAVALGRTYLLPPLSSGGALVVQP
jgi:hypothetical protein